MKILPLGIDYSTGAPLLKAQNEGQFANAIVQHINAHLTYIRPMSTETNRGLEVSRPRGMDLGDPGQAGWTFMVNEYDPHCDEIIRILRPLAIRRGMKTPERPLHYQNQRPETWFSWILENLTPIGVEIAPFYILIVGGPEQVPFHFQSFLSASFAVGRLDFETLENLAVYVDKILAMENSSEPLVQRSAIFLAPDGGQGDATYYSRRYMAEPLAQLTENTLNIPTLQLFNEQASRTRILETLSTAQPALVYSASHGLVAPRQPIEFQKKFNGAIVCQAESSSQSLQDRLFSANDIPLEKPFLEGSIFFQFACFGYGTPAVSDFFHWQTGVTTPSLNSDFVAALPRRMLAHPRGPIAFIGHVDMAWLHGFADPDDPELSEWWSPRLKPFITTLANLLITQPVGYALREMNTRYNNVNAYLTNLIDIAQQIGTVRSEEHMRKIAYSYIVRNDAQNYMVFGDPAVRLRLPI